MDDHADLVDLARCMYGDEYRAVTPCGIPHDAREFTERLTFADVDEIVAMMRQLSPHLADGWLPVWVRNLAYRLAVLQRPDDRELLREAGNSLYLHGPDWDDLARDLLRRGE